MAKIDQKELDALGRIQGQLNFHTRRELLQHFIRLVLGDDASMASGSSNGENQTDGRESSNHSHNSTRADRPDQDESLAGPSKTLSFFVFDDY